MNCTDVLNLLHEYSDGSLEPEVKAAVEEHLGSCALCPPGLEQVRRLEALIQRAGEVPEPGPSFWDSQSGHLMRASMMLPAVRAVRKVPKVAWVAAAGAVAFIGAIVLLFSRMPARRVVQAPPAEPASAEAAAGKPEGGTNGAAPASAEAAAGKPAPAGALLPDPAPAPKIEPRRTGAAERPKPVEPPVPLPGSPGHFERLADEALRMGQAQTPSERLTVLFGAADARRSEFRAALKVPDLAMAEELLAAYTLLLKEGVRPILAETSFDPDERRQAREVAWDRAWKNVEALRELEPGVPETLRERFRDALKTAREVSK